MSSNAKASITFVPDARKIGLGPELPADELLALEKSMALTHDIVNKVFKTFAFNDPVLNRLCYRNTRDHKSYGYFINPLLHELYELIVRLKAGSLLDLGCGACIALEIVRRNMDASGREKVRFGGIEIEAPLINLAHKMFPDTYSITQADLMNLERHQVETYDILYMWEPIYDNDAAGKFVDLLVSLMHANQTIILKPNGNIATHLSVHPKVSEVKMEGRSLALFHLKP